jgi:hypothetical protein
MEEGTAATPTVDSTLYEVKLEVFEGPLDLLLYLIRKDELDIYDIPIAHITSEYLAFLQDVHRLDVEQASEFILMAATLMKVTLRTRGSKRTRARSWYADCWSTSSTRRSPSGWAFRRRRRLTGT